MPRRPHPLLRAASTALTLLTLATIGIRQPADAADVRPLGAVMISAGMPSGFEGMSEDQQVVADFYFGGRPIGQYAIEFAPGHLRILHPEQVTEAIPGIEDIAAVRDALALPRLDSNARYLCSPTTQACERPNPETAAVVFDQQRFRVDVYVNPHYLAVRPVGGDQYLSPFGHGVALVDTIAAAITGGDDERPEYTLRSRSILSAGNARIASETSYSSGDGLNVDTLAAEIDRPNVRYTAGMFYAPGADLIGRRRIVGAGVASQFDTRTDRNLMTGSPIIVFLSQRSRVDLFSGGRLISSNTYEAGNQALDTSALPDGSYPVEIRIQEAGGASRVEHRFFSRSASVPPPGHTVFFTDAGLLATDRRGSLIAVSKTPLAMAGLARRVGTHWAYDAVAMATNRKGLAEVGVSFLSPILHTRLAVLGSSTGDYGLIAQANSTTSSALSYNLDIRRVFSHDGRPLIPLDTDNDPLSISTTSDQTSQLIATSFTQLVGNLSYRIRFAQLGLAGSYRRDVGRGATYAIGPTVHWPILQRRQLQLTFDGAFAQTDRGRSMAFGLRLQIMGKRSSLSATVGAQTSAPGESHHIGAIAGIDGTIQRSNVLGSDISAAGGVQQGVDGTLIQGAINERGPFGYLSGNLIHRSDGMQSNTQYGAGLQTSFAIARNALAIGTRDQNDSIITVRLGGSAHAARFEVLIDDAPRGVIRPGGQLSTAVSPYRRYTVRIRPIGGELVAFDAQPKRIDVYPGTVASLKWTADTVLAMFGRLVRPDGAPVKNADITTHGAIASSDGQGYFQIQAPGDATLTVRSTGGIACHATLQGIRSDKGYTALGDVPCS